MQKLFLLSINVEIISFNPVGHSHPSSLAFVTDTLTNGQKGFWTIGSLYTDAEQKQARLLGLH